MEIKTMAIANRILIIDDEDDIREVAKASLELMGGFTVLVASSSKEGLIKAEIEQPDAILLDVMLPDMDGTTAFKHLQKNPATSQIPVILLTAKVQSADQRQFADLGVRAVIPKPFDPINLANQISEVLGWELQ
jgi:CheY-like chemotaxis protein